MWTHVVGTGPMQLIQQLSGWCAALSVCVWQTANKQLPFHNNSNDKNAVATLHGLYVSVCWLVITAQQTSSC